MAFKGRAWFAKERSIEVAGRKLVVKQAEVQEAVAEPALQATVDSLLKKKILTDLDIEVLVSAGCSFDELAKDFGDKTKEIKDRLKIEAANAQVEQFEADTAVAIVSSTTSKELDFAAVYRFLKSQNKLNLLADLVSVKIQVFERVFGADTIEEIGKVTTVPYARLAFKRKK